MKNNLNEELNRLRYLLGYNPGQLMTESQVKGTYLSEQENDSSENTEPSPEPQVFDKFGNRPNFKFEEKPKLYEIIPSKPQSATRLYVAVIDNKIYPVNGLTGKIFTDMQIGGWKGQAEAYAAKNEKSPIIKMGNEFVRDRNNGNMPKGYFTWTSPPTWDGYAFIFNDENVPTLIGLIGNGPEVMAGVITKPYEPKTPPPPQTIPEPITLNLKNSFYYDCPNKPGCGTRGGTNQDPLTSRDAYKQIDIFADKINKYYTDKKPIYVLGFASLEGSNQHNLELSQFRANFVANRIQNRITNPNIRIIPMGMGETNVFQSGNTESDYIENRRIIVTLDPSSTTPYVFTFKK